MVLTGTPGTGKTTLGRAIAKLTGAKLVDANALVKKKRLWFNRTKREVDLAALKREIKREIKAPLADGKGFIAEGHLLCEFALPCDACLVLRCNPCVLARRLKARGYSKKKISENVLCEILDYCLVKAEAHYGAKRVVEVDTTRRTSPARLLKAAQTKRGNCTNWSGVLLDERFKNGFGLS
ncbi:MAG: AAA family ATPase [Candidatus Norongarragalinales archaeon]